MQLIRLRVLKTHIRDMERMPNADRSKWMVSVDGYRQISVERMPNADRSKWMVSVDGYRQISVDGIESKSVDCCNITDGTRLDERVRLFTVCAHIPEYVAGLR
jgi:hypothetical protein